MAPVRVEDQAHGEPHLVDQLAPQHGTAGVVNVARKGFGQMG